MGLAAFAGLLAAREGAMNFFPRLGSIFFDDRLAANLVAIHGVITLAVLVALVLRRLISRGSSRLARWTGLAWLAAAGEEAARRLRALLFWLTILVVLLLIAGGVGYHLYGRDIRHDLGDWYRDLTTSELVHLVFTAGLIAAILIAAWLGVRMLRRIRVTLQDHVKAALSAGDQNLIRRWFNLLQGYGVFSIRLGAVWLVARELGAGYHVRHACNLFFRVVTIVALARLLALSCRVLSRSLVDLGNRFLAKKPFENYWDRFTRLIPFGERCFDTAVYVGAAWLCVACIFGIEPNPDKPPLGEQIVKCIGIFFVTRVLIELLQVLLSEAFGLYKEEETTDQKGRTLVPLLCSISQYVLYFGSAIMMMHVLDIPTQPILAGAGIVGLAVGLGAQSLVNDVVSGFFILFENQYLVGDYVQIGDASGIVEAVGIRVTQIRDGQGKVYIIPNGQIKGVVSYSKGHVNAVVDLKVPSGTDLEAIFRAMAEAGRRLRQAHREVLADTQIHGLVDLGTSDMTVRAVTRVRPGAHVAMQNEYRRLLKQVLDQNAAQPNRPLAA
jgi:small conductance mechanosensitive channel